MIRQDTDEVCLAMKTQVRGGSENGSDVTCCSFSVCVVSSRNEGSVDSRDVDCGTEVSNRARNNSWQSALTAP